MGLPPLAVRSSTSDGSNLKPGVKGAADTPEKMKRKGSFLTRHFTHPSGPMLDEKGKPTRLALSAHAWGEPVPATEAAAKKLAAKGRKLLEKYHASQEVPKPGKTANAKSPTKKTAVRKSASKAAPRTAAKTATKSARTA